jgi:hypothetical protein
MNLMPLRSSRGLRAGIAALTLSALAACAGDQPLRFLGLPGSATATEVTEVVPRAGYLDVRLGAQRFFFPADAECQALLAPGARVYYVEGGVLGRVEGEEAEEGACEPVGVGSLQAWRDRKPRPSSSRPNPRAQIVYREIYRDEEVAFLRGRFPLASHARLRGDDIIAVISAHEPCLETAGTGRQTGTMEFRQAGRDPFRAFLGASACPISAFVLPLGPF